ncbi:pectinesterase family protein [Luteimicrobium subarcticum]|uniref:Pectin methylesterase-like acyl-CoA thioesterase n=1 Tax=Luteimicrobium subarcticum TaxID=620910 RepID=A0A2M8WTK6_9MICO|nr:pectinesterase family protein [Luteimicrobium subarcticum]PJI94214.1 pectin methylesterase-like acyl-CoA thioesterase [Luteimicrobium subarcticum]
MTVRPTPRPEPDALTGTLRRVRVAAAAVVGAARASRHGTRVIVAGATAGAIALGGLAVTPAFAADTTAPSKPSSVGAAYYGHVGTVVTWGKVSASDLAAYRVYRSTSSSPTLATSTLVASTTSLMATDTTVAVGTKAYYAVVAVDKSGNASGFSSVKTVTATDTTKPSSVSSLKATASSSGIALDWADNDEIDLAGYRVERALRSSGPWTVLAAAAGSSSYTDTTAPAGVTSYYHVTALDLTGNASSAASASAKRPAGAPVVPVAPSAPTSLTATAPASGGVTLSWTAASGATSYTVARATSADGPYTQVATTTSTTYADAAAPARTTVRYRVSAVNAAGSSAPATASVDVPGDTVRPATPQSAKATILPSGGVTITWKANADKDLAGYTVLKRDEDTHVYAPYVPGPGGDLLTLPTFTDPSVTEGVTGYYRLRAVDTSGNESKAYLAVTADNKMVAPGAPTSFKVTQDPTAGLDLAWTAPKDLDVAGYAVYRNTTSSSTGFALVANVTAADAGAAPRFVDSSAPKGVTVYYKVLTVDQVGNTSSFSSTVSGTSLTTPVPLPVVENVLTVGAGKQFTTIGAALDSVPRFTLQRYRIDIDPGTYDEVLRIRSPYVTLHGTGGSAAATVIEADQASGSPDPAEPGETLGTAGSAVVRVDGSDVTLRNLTVANTFDESAHPDITSQQAVALRVEGDRFVGDSIRLVGNQDTLLADTPKPTTRIRQYYVNSYIEGDVDFVFGAATAVFDHVTFRALDRGKSTNGYLTAASTDTGSKYGFLITDSKLVSDAADGTINLGRPWHPSADPDALGSVVVRDTWLPAALDTAAPWDDMATANSSGVKVNFSWTGARFDEYANVGPGAGTGPDRPQLTDKDAENATPEKYLAGKDGWDPVLPPSTVVPGAPTGVVAASDLRVAHLTWDDDESADVVGWTVYRADDTGAFTKVGTTDQPTYSDTSVENGATYRYVVTADTRDGTASPTSDPVTVTVEAARLVVDYTVDASAPTSATSFRTLSDALAAAPAGTATDPTVIQLAAGRYAEYDTVSKPYTVLVGATGTASDVVITGNHAAGTPTGTTTDGVADTYGTAGSATLVITGSNVQLRDLTVENAYVEGTYANGQAVALRTTGDRLVYTNVRLLGNQDTLYANSPAATSVARTYVYDSVIEGDVDFVFGRGTVVIDDSTLHVLDHGTSPNGAVTAASTDVSNPFGFLITHSRIIGTAPDASQNLGRPWQPGQKLADGTSVADTNALGQVTVRDSWLGPVVSATAWTDMVNSGTTTSWRSARFSEYHNDGPGAVASTDRAQLSDAAAAGRTAQSYLAGTDGWDPTVPAGEDTAPAAVTGLAANPDEGLVALDWDDAPAADVTTYRVYRSTTDAHPAATVANLVAEVQKSELTDRDLADGTRYTYEVVAVDRAGQTGPASGPVTATPAERPLVADATVAADGTGDYTSVQAALDAVGAGTAAKPKVVVVEPGTYREVVVGRSSNVLLAGATGDPTDVAITFDNANGTTRSATTCPQVTSVTCGTGGSATVTLSGSGVQVRDLTISNTFDPARHPEIGPNNTQAVALRAIGDRQVYRDVRLVSTQDTLEADASGNITADGSGYPRQYYVDSSIEGDVDFVFGRASAAFERVTFHATVHSGGAVFAPSTASKARGYLVVDSRIASDNDPGTYNLGRPWPAWSDGTQPDTSRGQVVIRNTWLGAGLTVDKPWTDFAPNAWTDGRFFEYANTGPGARVTANRPQLTAAQAGSANVADWLAGTDGWQPRVVAGADTAPAAPRGLVASPDSGKVTLTWDESSEHDVTGYVVLRDGAEVATTFGASYADSDVVDGTAYRYTVEAVDAAGQRSKPSGAVTATPVLHVDATVAADGSGDYTTLGAALAAAPASGAWVVEVEPGTYAGTTTVSRKDTTVIGGGDDRDAVVLTNATSTATLAVTGSGVTVRGLTVQNTTASGTAPALSMTADKVLVEDAVLSSSGNRTVFADTSTYTASARQMITGSTVVGGNDVLLGRATLVVHDSTVRVRTNGTVLTPSTAESFKGFLLVGSRVETPGATNVQLGRPYRAWADTYTPRSVGQAVVRDTDLGAGVASAAWGTGPAGEPWTLGRFAEFGNTGAGAATGAVRPQLSPAESLGVTVEDWLGSPTWYPAVADPAVPDDVRAPADVTGLAATAADGSARLTWVPPTDADLAGYRVYRSTGSVTATPSALVATLGAVDSWKDSGLVDGTTYHYLVVSLDTLGNASAGAALDVTSADTVAPAAPTGVTAVGGEAKVTLSWPASTESDLAGYHVYRDGERADATLVSTPRFTDTGLVDGTSYRYTVTAVDVFGNESSRSDAVVAVPTPGDGEAPAAPTSVSTVLGKGSVTVAWAPVDADDLATYDVVRDGTVVATVGATTRSWTDTSVTVGTSYRYAVVAVDASGNRSAASAPATVVPVKVDVLVDPAGGGDATTVQAGIDSLPNNADFTTQGYRTVLVLPGTYSGAIASGNRYGVKVVGATGDPKDVVVTAPGGATATATVSGASWTFQDLTLQSVAATSGAQATALQVKSGDKQVVDHVRLLGDAKAVQVSTANVTTYSRVYITDSYLEGGADLLLGRAVTVVDHSEIHVLARSGAAITDSSVASASPFGFLVTDSSITADGAAGSFYLGRPYPENATAQAQVVVRGTSLPAALVTGQPWKDYSSTALWTSGRFFEYANTGPGAGTGANRPQLDDAAAAGFTARTYLAGSDGWDPTGH